MGIKENSRTFLVSAKEEILHSLKMPKLHLISNLDGLMDYIHMFVERGEEQEE